MLTSDISREQINIIQPPNVRTTATNTYIICLVVPAPGRFDRKCRFTKQITRHYATMVAQPLKRRVE